MASRSQNRMEMLLSVGVEGLGKAKGLTSELKSIAISAEKTSQKLDKSGASASVQLNQLESLRDKVAQVNLVKKKLQEIEGQLSAKTLQLNAASQQEVSASERRIKAVNGNIAASALHAKAMKQILDLYPGMSASIQRNITSIRGEQGATTELGIKFGELNAALKRNQEALRARAKALNSGAGKGVAYEEEQRLLNEQQRELRESIKLFEEYERVNMRLAKSRARVNAEPATTRAADPIAVQNLTPQVEALRAAQSNLSSAVEKTSLKLSEINNKYVQYDAKTGQLVLQERLLTDTEKRLQDQLEQTSKSTSKKTETSRQTTVATEKQTVVTQKATVEAIKLRAATLDDLKANELLGASATKAVKEYKTFADQTDKLSTSLKKLDTDLNKDTMSTERKVEALEKLKAEISTVDALYEKYNRVLKRTTQEQNALAKSAQIGPDGLKVIDEAKASKAAANLRMLADTATRLKTQLDKVRDASGTMSNKFVAVDKETGLVTVRTKALNAEIKKLSGELDRATSSEKKYGNANRDMLNNIRRTMGVQSGSTDSTKKNTSAVHDNEQAWNALSQRINNQFGGAMAHARRALGALRNQILVVMFATRALRGVLGEAFTQSRAMEAALKGLSSVALNTGNRMGYARDAALSLAKSGLLSVQEAASGLKNLLSAGFGMDQAISLMRTLTDSASFNRQGTLALGEAVIGATQGIKNQNSIMVDNAGITKNLSIMFKEYSASIGTTMGKLSEAGKRQAIFSGIMKEGAIFAGDAQKVLGTMEGTLATLAASSKLASAALGDTLRGALNTVLVQVEHWVTKSGEFVNGNEKLAASFEAWGTRVGKAIQVLLAGATALTHLLGGPLSGAVDFLITRIALLVAIKGVWSRINAKAEKSMGQLHAQMAKGELVATKYGNLLRYVNEGVMVSPLRSYKLAAQQAAMGIKTFSQAIKENGVSLAGFKIALAGVQARQRALLTTLGLTEVKFKSMGDIWKLGTGIGTRFGTMTTKVSSEVTKLGHSLFTLQGLSKTVTASIVKMRTAFITVGQSLRTGKDRLVAFNFQAKLSGVLARGISIGANSAKIAMAGMAAAASSAAIALRGLVATMGSMAAMMVLFWVFEKLIGYFGKAGKKAEEMDERIRASSAVMQGAGEKLRSYKDAVKSLSEEASSWGLDSSNLKQSLAEYNSVLKKLLIAQGDLLQKTNENERIAAQKRSDMYEAELKVLDEELSLRMQTIQRKITGFGSTMAQLSSSITDVIAKTIKDGLAASFFEGFAEIDALQKEVSRELDVLIAAQVHDHDRYLQEMQRFEDAKQGLKQKTSASLEKMVQDAADAQISMLDKVSQLEINLIANATEKIQAQYDQRIKGIQQSSEKSVTQIGKLVKHLSFGMEQTQKESFRAQSQELEGFLDTMKETLDKDIPGFKELGWADRITSQMQTLERAVEDFSVAPSQEKLTSLLGTMGELSSSYEKQAVVLGSYRAAGESTNEITDNAVNSLHTLMLSIDKQKWAIDGTAKTQDWANQKTQDTIAQLQDYAKALEGVTAAMLVQEKATLKAALSAQYYKDVLAELSGLDAQLRTESIKAQTEATRMSVIQAKIADQIKDSYLGAASAKLTFLMKNGEILDSEAASLRMSNNQAAVLGKRVTAQQQLIRDKQAEVNLQRQAVAALKDTALQAANLSQLETTKLEISDTEIKLEGHEALLTLLKEISAEYETQNTLNEKAYLAALKLSSKLATAANTEETMYTAPAIRQYQEALSAHQALVDSLSKEGQIAYRLSGHRKEDALAQDKTYRTSLAIVNLQKENLAFFKEKYEKRIEAAVEQEKVVQGAKDELEVLRAQTIQRLKGIQLAKQLGIELTSIADIKNLSVDIAKTESRLPELREELKLAQANVAIAQQVQALTAAGSTFQLTGTQTAGQALQLSTSQLEVAQAKLQVLEAGLKVEKDSLTTAQKALDQELDAYGIAEVVASKRTLKTEIAALLHVNTLEAKRSKIRADRLTEYGKETIEINKHSSLLEKKMFILQTALDKTNPDTGEKVLVGNDRVNLQAQLEFLSVEKYAYEELARVKTEAFKKLSELDFKNLETEHWQAINSSIANGFTKYMNWAEKRKDVDAQINAEKLKYLDEQQALYARGEIDIAEMNERMAAAEKFYAAKAQYERTKQAAQLLRDIGKEIMMYAAREAAQSGNIGKALLYLAGGGLAMATLNARARTLETQAERRFADAQRMFDQAQVVKATPDAEGALAANSKTSFGGSIRAENLDVTISPTIVINGESIFIGSGSVTEFASELSYLITNTTQQAIDNREIDLSNVPRN